MDVSGAISLSTLGSYLLLYLLNVMFNEMCKITKNAFGRCVYSSMEYTFPFLLFPFL